MHNITPVQTSLSSTDFAYFCSFEERHVFFIALTLTGTQALRSRTSFFTCRNVVFGTCDIARRSFPAIVDTEIK